MDPTIAEYLRAVFFGAVQAITEFLPVSSSGHLILAPKLIGQDASSLTFDVGLHIGTLTAVLAYFWRDWLSIGRNVVLDLGREGVRVQRWGARSRLGLWLVVSTLPAVLAGLLFDSWIEEHVRQPEFVGITLIVFGVVLGVADRWGSQVRQLYDMTAGSAFLVGLMQAIALLPGVSRSGITISAARGLGFDRSAAARFSFLMSAPVVAGAGVLKMADALSGDEVVHWGPLLAGALTAAVLGALVISGFLRLIQHRTLAIFVWYRIALGLVVLIAAATGNLQ